MAEIEFFYHPYSTPSRCVWMTLEALGLDYKMIVVDILKGEQKSDKFKAINYRCKLPAIRHGEVCVAESRAIAMYLCNAFGAQQGKIDLYPTDPVQRALIDQQLFVDENLIWEIMLYLNTMGILFRGETTHKIEHLGQVQKSLQYYDDLLKEHEYIATNHLSIADFFALGAVKHLSVANFHNFEAFPRLETWLVKMESLPYYKKTMAEPLKLHIKFIKDKIDENTAKNEIMNCKPTRFLPY